VRYRNDVDRLGSQEAKRRAHKAHVVSCVPMYATVYRGWIQSVEVGMGRSWWYVDVIRTLANDRGWTKQKGETPDADDFCSLGEREYDEQMGKASG